MKQIEILYEKRYKTLPQKMEKDLLWYDTITKEMKTFKGGRLKFSYDLNEHRMIPEVEEVHGRKTSFLSNKDEFNNWFEKYSNRYNSDIIKTEENDDNVFFNIPDDEFEDFISEIEGRGFAYNEI